MKTGLIPSPLNPTGAPDTNPKAQAQYRAQLIDDRQWLERLIANEDFRRFRAFYRQGQKSTQRQAEDIDSNDAEKRDAYAQRYFGICGLLDWPEEQLEGIVAQLQKLDESAV